jgi:hypothetical protein
METEKSNVLNDKKQKLKTKPWFRTLQVVYVAAIIMVWFSPLIWGAGDNSYGDLIMWTIFIFVIFWITRKVGYYIIIGNLDTIKSNKE